MPFLKYDDQRKKALKEIEQINESHGEHKTMPMSMSMSSKTWKTSRSASMGRWMKDEGIIGNGPQVLVRRRSGLGLVKRAKCDDRGVVMTASQLFPLSFIETDSDYHYMTFTGSRSSLFVLSLPSYFISVLIRRSNFLVSRKKLSECYSELADVLPVTGNVYWITERSLLDSHCRVAFASTRPLVLPFLHSISVLHVTPHTCVVFFLFTKQVPSPLFPPLSPSRNPYSEVLNYNQFFICSFGFVFQQSLQLFWVHCLFPLRIGALIWFEYPSLYFSFLCLCQIFQNSRMRDEELFTSLR